MKTLNKKNIACLVAALPIALASCGPITSVWDKNKTPAAESLALSYAIQTQIAQDGMIQDLKATNTSLEAALASCSYATPVPTAAPTYIPPADESQPAGCKPSVVIPSYRLDGVGADDYTRFGDSVRWFYEENGIPLNGEMTRVILDYHNNEIETLMGGANGQTFTMSAKPEDLDSLLDLTSGMQKETLWYTRDCLDADLKSKGYDAYGFGWLFSDNQSGYSQNDIADLLNSPETELVTFAPNPARPGCADGGDPVVTFVQPNKGVQQVKVSQEAYDTFLELMGIGFKY